MDKVKVQLNDLEELENEFPEEIKLVRKFYFQFLKNKIGVENEAKETNGRQKKDKTHPQAQR